MLYSRLSTLIGHYFVAMVCLLLFIGGCASQQADTGSTSTELSTADPKESSQSGADIPSEPTMAAETKEPSHADSISTGTDEADPVVKIPQPSKPSKAELLAKYRSAFDDALDNDRLSVPNKNNAIYWAYRWYRLSGDESEYNRMIQLVSDRYMALAEEVPIEDSGRFDSLFSQAKKLGADPDQLAALRKDRDAKLLLAQSEVSNQDLATDTENTGTSEMASVEIGDDSNVTTDSNDEPIQLDPLQFRVQKNHLGDHIFIVHFSDQEIDQQSLSVSGKLKQLLPLVQQGEFEVVVYSADKNTYDWLYQQIRLAINSADNQNPNQWDGSSEVAWQESRFGAKLAFYPSSTSF